MNALISRRIFSLFLACLTLSIASISLAAEAELPYTFQKKVMIPMRDGTKLAANIFLPKEAGRFPVVLMRTPYGRPGETWGGPKRYCPAGYVMVTQDCRGRGESEGKWEPWTFDAQDGFDTQEWIGSQPWCNGKIGTTGGSYVGWTQWSAAHQQSKYLKTMVPVVPFADPYHDIAYVGGAFQLSLSLGWGVSMGGVKVEPAKLPEAFKYLPLNKWDAQFDKQVPYLNEWVNHPTYDDYWRKVSIEGHYAQVTVPALNIGGWYDIFSKNTIELVNKTRKESANALARKNQFVIMGPWGHGVGGTKSGEVDFTQKAQFNVGEAEFQWFEHWLKDKNTQVKDWAPYRLFIMGENVWRDEHEWPLKRTQFTPFYFHSGGQANTRMGNGTLSVAAPMSEPADTFTYDSNNPVPTHGGNNLIGAAIGPFDQSTIEERKDVLVYTSAPLTKAVEVTGPVKVILYAASSAKDTDFTAKLVDVGPDGKAFNLCDGIIRARYRNSETNLELIEPGKTYRYEIDLWVTANLFKEGHRIRVEISSSNFPRFDRNPNSGKPFGTDTELLKAEQTIHHDQMRASHILLPVIPR
ncbi:MAG: hypothetical protein K0Q55_574 [Verrucomicrobia bacterium]|jgi:putative CocE/NonD family hydrolase|nr:hypothetical protein [Verrucomicrobiota bacterium]